MKRTVKILALVLVFVMAATALVSCGKRLSGDYEGVGSDGNVVGISFKGKNFVFTQGTTELKGTYKIEKKGDNYTITMIYDETVVNGKSTKLEEPKEVHKDSPLRIGEGYITIGSGTGAKKYTKN